jgi:hypothetical protein
LVAFFAVLACSVLVADALASGSHAFGSRRGAVSTRSAATAASARHIELAARRVAVARPAGAHHATPARLGCFASAAGAGHGALHFVTIQTSAGGVATLAIRRYRQPTLLARTPACAPAVQIGHTYRLSLRYSSTSGAVSLATLTESRGTWRVTGTQRLKASRSLRSASVLVGPIGSGVQRLALGVLVEGVGVVRATAFSIVDASAHIPAPGAPTGFSPGKESLPKEEPPAKEPPAKEQPKKELPKEEKKEEPKEEPKKEAPKEEEPLSQCAQLAKEELPTELSLPEAPLTEPLSVTGRWSVREGLDHARTVHAVLLQNGKLLLMAGSGNSRMEFDAGCFRSYVYNPLANTYKEIQTPKDLFCGGHVQLANGNVLILGGTKEYPPPPKPGEFPSTIYKGENTSWIFNIKTEEYEQVPYNELEPHQPKEPGPLLSGAWYPSATELGNGNVISFGGLNEEGTGATSTNYYIAPYNQGNPGAGDPAGQWVGFGSSELQQTYDWFWGLYPSMILTADGRLFYDGSHVFGNGVENETPSPAPDGSAIYDFYCTPGKTQKEEEKEQSETNPSAQVRGPEVDGGPESTDKEFPRVQNTPGLEHVDQRDQSASLLLPPAQDQKVMVLGGGNTYNTSEDATNSTDEINLLEADPQWKKGPDLPRGRLDDGELEPKGMGKMYVSAVALPDGTVLETGGSLLPRTKDVHEGSIFNPTTNEFSPVAPDPVGRDYHSEALLLPDGDVIALGSNPVNEGGGEGFQTAISIYEPPYMFKGERPVIETVDGEKNVLDGSVNKTSQWEYASKHLITYTSKSSEIKSAVLIRPAAVTHSSDPNQREVELPITGVMGASGESKTLEVGLTSNPNLAPPGYYMLFLDNANGVPSEAQWVHVGPQGDPEKEP